MATVRSMSRRSRSEDELASKPLVADLGSVNALAYQADGQAIAVATSSGVAMVDTHSVAPVVPRWLDTDGSEVWAVTFVPDGSVFWADEDSIDVQAPTDDGDQRLGSDRRWDDALAFNATGDRLVAGGDDSVVTVFDLETGDVIGPPRTLPWTFPVQTVAVCPSGDRIAAAGNDGIVRQWPMDQTYGETTAVMTLPTTDGNAGAIRRIQLTSDEWSVGSDHRVAAAEGNGGALIWQVEPGRNPKFLMRIDPQPDSWTKSVALNGDRLAMIDVLFNDPDDPDAPDGSILSLYDLSKRCGSDDSCPARFG